jgi:TolB protein
VTQDEGRQSLWVRQVATSGIVQVVPPSPNGYLGLTFSRDGEYIYYAVLERQDFSVLYRVPALGGGLPRKLVEEAIGPVAFSPDGRRMAFIRGNHTLMVSDLDGGGATALAGRQGGESWQLPSWSPDGEKIACGVYSPDGNVWRLVEVSVKDGTERPLTQQKWQSVWGLAWLPGGDGLMVSGRYPETRHLQVWLLSYPGGEVRRVTNDLSSYVGLSLTADGQTLASVQGERLVNVWVAPAADAERARRVTTEAGRDEGLNGLALTPDGRVVYTARASEGSDLWIVGEDGRENLQLTANARDNYSPCVAPDGRHVVFVSTRTGRAQLWRMGIDGSNPVQLTDGPGTAVRPDCSPDGKWVFYHLSAGGARNVWKVALDGGAPVRLTDVSSARPVVSPDGRLVACAYGEAKPDAQIKLAVIPSEGGPPVRLIEAPAAVKSLSLRWSPDGRRIVYIDSRDRVSNLWEQPLDGGQPAQLTNFKTDQVFQFDRSRDGKRLALARGREGSDVVLISNFHDR